MKEAIGGTWIFGMVITFLALFTTFVSVSTNYSRCYKIKDEVLLAIERAHGINEDSVNSINKFLKGTGYSSVGKCPDDGNCWFSFNINESYSSGSYRPAGDRNTNYCLAKYMITRNTSDADNRVIYTNGPVGHPESAYYGAVIFFRLEWPILRSMFSIDISGETSIIYLVNDFDEVNEKCYG